METIRSESHCAAPKVFQKQRAMVSARRWEGLLRLPRPLAPQQGYALPTSVAVILYCRSCKCNSFILGDCPPACPFSPGLKFSPVVRGSPASGRHSSSGGCKLYSCIFPSLISSPLSYPELRHVSVGTPASAGLPLVQVGQQQGIQFPFDHMQRCWRRRGTPARGALCLQGLTCLPCERGLWQPRRVTSPPPDSWLVLKSGGK